MLLNAWTSGENSPSQSSNGSLKPNAASHKSAEKSPTLNPGRFALFWPEIRAAIAEGQSLKSIRQWLEEEGGVVVTVQSLGSYLTRIRRKEQLRPVPQTAPTAPVEPTESKGVPRAQKKKHRFEYPPGPPDESKLI